MRASQLSFGILVYLAGCDHGNVQPSSSWHAPATPVVRNPSFDPYQPFAQANATWRPPILNRDGTIVKPAEPSSQSSRPDYESTPWATGAGDPAAGTF